MWGMANLNLVSTAPIYTTIAFQMNPASPDTLRSLSSTSGDLSSPTSQASHCTPSKRKLSSSSHREPLHALPVNVPPAPRPHSEPTVRLKEPKTPHGTPTSSTKKPKSAPGCFAESKSESIEDEAVPSRGLQTERKYSSPCGKSNMQQGRRLDKHQRGCDKCNRIVSKRLEECQETQSGMTHQQFIEEKDNRATESAEDGMISRFGTSSSQFHHRFNSKLDSASGVDRESQRQNDHKEQLATEGQSPSWASSSLPGEALPAEIKAVESELAQEITRDETPLGLEDELYPEGVPTAIPAGSSLNGLQLHYGLLEKLERKLTPKDQNGFIYILSDPTRPRLYKIGRTKRTELRRKQIQYTCGLGLELVQRYQVGNYVRTEALIHAYLSDLCRPYSCGTCGKKHGEWFEVTKNLAKVHVSRWVKFMNHQSPYDPDSRELGPFLKKLVALRDQFSESHDAEVFRKEWIQILSPTALDHLGYRFDIVWALLWKFYWPVNSMVAWTITFLAFQHPVTFALMAASVIGTLVTMAQEIHRLRHDNMASTKLRRQK